MSLETLKLDLESRSGRDLLPSSFPIELLIALTRELGHIVSRSMSLTELRAMHDMLSGYLRSLVEMLGTEALANFEANAVEITPRLLDELYGVLTEEIVSRLIGYSVSITSLRERFGTVLDVVEQAS